MRIIVLTLVLLNFSPAQAHLEHRPGMEEIPSKDKLRTARGCFIEFRKLGCAHPREGLGFFKTCLDKNSDQLGSECRVFFTKLYGNRK